MYPGQTVTSIVTIENKGYDEQDDVKVEVSIDDLNIKHSDYIFNLDQTERDITRDLEIDIPTDVKAGTYKGTVTATFNSGYKSVSHPFSITITTPREKAVAEKKLLVSMPQSVEFTGSEAERLTLTVANPNKAEKVLSVAVVGKDVDASVEKSFKIIQAYDETTFNIDVQANEYTRKDSSFNVVIKEEDKVLEEVKVEVVQAGNGIWNVNWANVGVLVLGVLLVFLVISLIGSLSKRHHDGKDGDETNEEEYY